MLVVAALLGAVALGVCLLEWRVGVLLTVAVGLLADPVRKLIPGEPVELNVIVGAFAAASFVGILRAGGWRYLAYLMRRYQRLQAPLQWFLLWLAVGVATTVITFGSAILAGIGLIAYLAPLPAILLGYAFGSSLQQVKRFATLYVAIAFAMASGIFLEWRGVEMKGLGQVGGQMLISGVGEALGGFFRAPEVAAWHAATAICLLAILGVSVAKKEMRPIIAVLIVVLLAAGILTGRRKMLAQLMLFVALYALILAYFRSEAKRLVSMGIVLAFVGALAGNELLARSGDEERLQLYTGRGATVLVDAPERAARLGLMSVIWSLRRHGIFGSGAGVSSQGAQHFGGGIEIGGGGAEGGLGKITAELGIPGLFLSFWLGITLFRLVLRDLHLLSRAAPQLVTLAGGFVAFLGAQIPTFAVASPIYGDPFVLILLGSILGFTLAVTSWVEMPARRVVALSSSVGSEAQDVTSRTTS